MFRNLRLLALPLAFLTLVTGCGEAPLPEGFDAAQPLVIYKVDSISCEGCCNTIQEELAALPGVKKVTADPKSKLVHVQVADAKFDSKTILDRLNEIKYAECKVVRDVKN